MAFFIAKRIRSNVRELEGALRRVIANSRFTGRPITLEFAKEALKDLLALQERLVTIENIQKTVAEYYKIRVADLLSKRRSRSIARPRQMAMALAKELTNHSLPEIGDAFGGRDHTTVLHACAREGTARVADARRRGLPEPVENPDRMMWTGCGETVHGTVLHISSTGCRQARGVLHCSACACRKSREASEENAVLHSLRCANTVVIDIQ